MKQLDQVETGFASHGGSGIPNVLMFIQWRTSIGVSRSILMFGMLGFEYILGLEVGCEQMTLHYRDGPCIECCAPRLAAHERDHRQRSHTIHTKLYTLAYHLKTAWNQ